MQWLQGHGSQAQIRAALSSVLARIWAAGFQLGLQAAQAAGVSLAILNGLLEGDLLSQLQSAWLDEIIRTRLDRLAAVLAEGGSAAELAQALHAVLADSSSAGTIAQTELSRADSAARFGAYQAAGIHLVRWVTTSANPCQACIANQAAGPWPLGHPFPSGVIMPPDHPHCQCHLEPAED